MNKPTAKQLEKMTLEDASAWLEQAVYETCLFIERLEHAGKYLGNGHHVAQRVAAKAVALLANGWDAEAEKKMLAKATMDFIRQKHPETKSL